MKLTNVMAQTSMENTTTSSLSGNVRDFSLSSATIDEPTNDEYYWYFTDWAKYLGYYQEIPELQSAVNGLAVWTAGRGYFTDIQSKIILEHIRGIGVDSFDEILQNLIITKKINGDSFAEIIRDPDTQILINLKPLNPASIRIVYGKNGLIKRYDEINPLNSKEVYRKLKTNQVFHLCNSRIANSVHGISSVQACKWVIDSKQEAMRDWRRILHRSTIRVLEVDAEDTETFNKLKTQYADAIKNGEVLILPKGNAEIKDYTAPPVETFLTWIRYLDNFFYEALNVPRAVTGGSNEYSEAGSKVGYLSWEQVYITEQRILEQDIWNQLNIRITFDRPVSLKEQEQGDESANGQLNFQPNETTTGVSRSE
jgi:hypothetical protein